MARVTIGADERKKLYMLGGLLAAIVVVIVVLDLPKGGSSTSSSPGDGAATGNAVTKTPPRPGQSTPPGGAQPGTPATGTPATGTPDSGSVAPADSAGGGGITAASLVSVEQFRPDPFSRPFILPPPPEPTPPPPPPPVEIQPPVQVLSPGESPMVTGGALPPFQLGMPAGTPPSRILQNLPPPRVSTVVSAPTAPRNFVPPGGQGSGGAGRSVNKRLSGVIIGDSVRALLEISDGENTTTRVVQPGDEVDGIRILRIERLSEGGRPVTRMFIRENGEERTVDLRAAPQVATKGEGGLGGGVPGRP